MELGAVEILSQISEFFEYFEFRIDLREMLEITDSGIVIFLLLNFDSIGY